jgi:RHS repeat-associated protein
MEVDSYTANVNATAVFTTSFVRDKLGRISQKTETVQGVTHVFDYSYDAAGRLEEVKKDSVVTATYTYDSNGNRLNNGAIYDDQDRLTTSAGNSYTYTPNGELLTKTNGSGTTTYSYDVLGNLISVILPSGTTIEYLVDGRNRRIGKKVNGTLERSWLYKDGLNPVAELDGTGAVVSRFIYTTRLNVPDFIIKGGVTYRIISDHLGSPRLVLDSTTGTVIQTMDFDVFGNVTGDTNPEFQPFAFAGGHYDPDTKLVRFGARDYDPEIGRWTSRDPIRFDGGGPNLYGYTQNDPINFVDPDGEAPKGERGQTGSRHGSNDPFKHTKPHPTIKDSVITKNNQTGKPKIGPRTPAFDEYWKKKEQKIKRIRRNLKEYCPAGLGVLFLFL